MSGHVFISYSHRNGDQGYAVRLANHLSEAGFVAWYDREIVSGDRWDRLIREKIDTCAAFVVVMTPAAENSDWVAREITHAERVGKPMLPLLLSGTGFFRLTNLQYEDVTGGVMPGPTFTARLRSVIADSSQQDAATDRRSVAEEPRDAPPAMSAWPRLPAISAGTPRGLSSRNSQVETFIEFVNLRSDLVVVKWLDFSGARVEYNKLGPGQRYVQQTYVTHPWVICDNRGTDLMFFLPAEQPGTAIIQ